MDTHKMARHDVFETTIDEDVTLEQLGYQQGEPRRNEQVCIMLITPDL